MKCPNCYGKINRVVRRVETEIGITFMAEYMPEYFCPICKQAIRHLDFVSLKEVRTFLKNSELEQAKIQAGEEK